VFALGDTATVHNDSVIFRIADVGKAIEVEDIRYR
jgi:hypothetical protein